MKRFRCVPLREELVMLTRDYKKAIVLGQMMYWAERVRDVQAYIEEEKNGSSQQEMVHGWFYKKAEELSEETLMGIQPKSMRTHLKYLVEQGWLFQRRNPYDKLDHTLQYRLNLVKIEHDLQELGSPLSWSTLSTSGVRSFAKGIPRAQKEPPQLQKKPHKRRKLTVSKVSKFAPEEKKENPSTCETLVSQGVPALLFPQKITNTKITESEITTEQTTQPTRVVVVREQIRELFGRELSSHKVETLIGLAQQEKVNLQGVIANTYTYHTKIKPCGNVFGALRYAIIHGEWQIAPPHPKHCTLTKAVREQLEQKLNPDKKNPDPEMAKVRKRIEQKIALLYGSEDSPQQ